MGKSAQNKEQIMNNVTDHQKYIKEVNDKADELAQERSE